MEEKKDLLNAAVLDDDMLDNVAGGYEPRSAHYNGIKFTEGDTVTLPGSYCGCGANGITTTGRILIIRASEVQIKTHCCGKIVYCKGTQITK